MDEATAKKVDAEIQALIATSRKLNEETMRQLQEPLWRTIIKMGATLAFAAAFVAAIIAMTKLFL